MNIPEFIKQARLSYIKKRNSIIDRPFLYFNPYWRYRLRKCDARFDEVDGMLNAMEKMYEALDFIDDHCLPGCGCRKNARDCLAEVEELLK